MRLVMIHGRSQQGKDRDALRQTWIDTWSKGLAKAGLPFPDSWDIRFPYYGDLLEQLVKAEKTPPGAKPRGSQAPDGLDPGLIQFETEVLSEIAASTGADPNAHFSGAARERGVANWEWVQAILRAIDDHLPGVGSHSVERFTRDVYYYLTLPHVRDQIDSTVLAELDSGPCVVVGHSLGSVVGYNVLHRCPPGVDVHRYVTVGSPLGVKAVQSRLDQPLKSPPCVADWFNAMDDRDVVALRPLTPSVFRVDPEIRNRTDVDNQTGNRHGIVGYLNDENVAREIRS